MNPNKKVLLLIWDGWGIGSNPEISAVHKAQKPYIDYLFSTYPHSKLQASGEAVGLPEGQMGNSEVGHLNIGAGRIVFQDLVRINHAFRDNTIKDNQTLKDALEKARETDCKLHLFGLVSSGGVHSHIEHLKGLCSLANEYRLKKVFIHCFMDGRDTDPHAGSNYLEDLQKHLNKTTGSIASVIGRYYAMDRDKRWERIRLGYDLLVHGKGKIYQNPVFALHESYAEGITDEFVKPVSCVNEKGEKLSLIEDGDVVVSFNFRKDRVRQLTQVLTQQDMPEFGMKKLNLHYVTMAIYDEKFKNVKNIFGRNDPKQTLGEIISQSGKKQIRIAETEKYPHVTFFFSGGREEQFTGESRILCPSPKVPTYDLQPEMSAKDIRDKIIPELKKKSADFICLNFANPDMVGHTGDFNATIKACETVNDVTEPVVKTALENDYSVIIIADHGNAEVMKNPDGTPHTAHTTNLVPCILCDTEFFPKLKDGKLCDVAPTILFLMGIPKPQEMSGSVLF
ncbi:MAG: phosphoglycerate mutase (2,3-diphosphoglycerate-independent) [Bacteroidetes bacterium RIFCSPLOWO2_02_FULL_36_8]|nr:MAG: phosphoglycerate mutase (2,3-diphosphoglycerate-independent) [Bacteroidetes bacterium RIFCSPLOWO2_02_FULL_36_8]OFY69841.1 MAG: phosphoglycerate mutase (2,3-diphosphoglycerate-independent) [Bacteroidetes bacterium RIFCSPLOWO2_12_FULL_37_12]